MGCGVGPRAAKTRHPRAFSLIARQKPITFAIADARFVPAPESTGLHALLASDATEAEQAACRKALAAWRELQIGAGAEQAVESRVHLIEALLNHNDFITVR